MVQVIVLFHEVRPSESSPESVCTQQVQHARGPSVSRGGYTLLGGRPDPTECLPGGLEALGFFNFIVMSCGTCIRGVNTMLTRASGLQALTLSQATHAGQIRAGARSEVLGADEVRVAGGRTSSWPEFYSEHTSSLSAQCRGTL